MKINVKKGDKYGRLTIIKEMENQGGKRIFLCLCDCGQIKNIRLSHLRALNTISCGCYNKEISTKVNTIHGMYYSKIYNIFTGIIDRCNNKQSIKYKNWGGRGIKCEWKSFEEFYKDMGPTYKEGLSIDRIDNNGNYCKENCRWATMKIQNRNKRNTLKYQNKPLIQWCEELNIKYQTVFARINRGWSMEKSLFTKIKHSGNIKQFRTMKPLLATS